MTQANTQANQGTPSWQIAVAIVLVFVVVGAVSIVPAAVAAFGTDSARDVPPETTVDSVEDLDSQEVDARLYVELAPGWYIKQTY